MQIRFGGTFEVLDNHAKATRIAQQIIGEEGGTLETDGDKLTISPRFDDELRRALADEGISFNELA